MAEQTCWNSCTCAELNFLDDVNVDDFCHTSNSVITLN